MSLAPNLPSTTKKELLSFQNGNSHGRLPCPKQHRHRRRHQSPHGWNRQSAMVGTRWRNRLARWDRLQSVLGRDPPPCMTQRPNLHFAYLGHRGERRTLGDMLASYVSTNPERWSIFLSLATFAYNTAVHSSTGFSPFY